MLEDDRLFELGQVLLGAGLFEQCAGVGGEGDGFFVADGAGEGDEIEFVAVAGLFFVFPADL